MASAKITQTGGTLQTTIQMRGFSLIADEPVDHGGTNTGPQPTELLLGALGACAAITGQLYARRKGWALDSVEIDVTHEKFKAADYPQYEGDSAWVNEFSQRITLKGDLTAEQRARIVEIMGKCPVHRILTEPNFVQEWLNEADSVPEQPV